MLLQDHLTKKRGRFLPQRQNTSTWNPDSHFLFCAGPDFGAGAISHAGQPDRNYGRTGLAGLSPFPRPWASSVRGDAAYIQHRLRRVAVAHEKASLPAGQRIDPTKVSPNPCLHSGSCNRELPLSDGSADGKRNTRFSNPLLPGSVSQLLCSGRSRLSSRLVRASVAVDGCRCRMSFNYLWNPHRSDIEFVSGEAGG